MFIKKRNVKVSCLLYTFSFEEATKNQNQISQITVIRSNNLSEDLKMNEKKNICETEETARSF